MATTYRVESGIQLLARLQKKPDLENFYPVLIKGGPKPGEVIEVFGKDCGSCFLIDIITEALIPASLGGVEAGVLLFNTDGNLHIDLLINNLREKIAFHASNSSTQKPTKDILDSIFHRSFANFSLLEVYDGSQLYTSLHSLDRILCEKPNISLIVFDTLTAFYWSEQGFKITKMDIYLKKILGMIQRITKDYKIIILYTRPEYFSSSKNSVEMLEQPLLDHVNYRIQLLANDDGSYNVILKTFSCVIKKTFNVIKDKIKWQ